MYGKQSMELVRNVLIASGVVHRSHESKFL